MYGLCANRSATYRPAALRSSKAALPPSTSGRVGCARFEALSEVCIGPVWPLGTASGSVKRILGASSARRGTVNLAPPPPNLILG